MKYFYRLLFVVLLSAFAENGNAQSACPSVNAGPDMTICGGCANLNAIVQGTRTSTSYTVASIPYVPFNYTTGTPVLVGVDDQWSDTINLPFCFQFYGNTFTTVILGSNGEISFDLANANGYNTWPISASVPTNTVPDQDNVIMGPWHDIDPSVAGNMFWELGGTAPCRYLKVSWDQIPMFSCNNLIDRQEIVLYETTNIIDVYIENKPICSSWNGGAAIEGLQDGTMTQAIVVPGRNYPTQWSASNDAWRFTPNGAPQYTVTWLQNNVSIGTTPSITVCPTTTSTYVAQVVNQTCNGPLTVSDTVVITVGNGNLTLATSSTPTTCTGSTGTATATPTGTGPFTYSWSTSPSQTTQTATGLSTGTYTVLVTDANGCQASMPVTVSASNNTITLTDASTPTACTANNGTASVTPSGGQSPYTYSWTPSSQTNAVATGLSAGSYTVTVTDANGCTALDTVVVLQNSNNLNLTLNTPATVCSGQSVNLNATVTGGTGPYSYSWAPGGQSTSSISVSPTTTTSYNCYVTDANGCTALQTVNVPVDPALVATSNGLNTICAGDSTVITASASGGTAGYTYSWAPVSSTATSVIVSPTTTTTYTVYVTDAIGCTDVSNGVTVTVNPTPVANFSSNPPTTTPTTNINFSDLSSVTSGNISTWYWSFGDGDTSQTQNPVHQYALPGTYNVCLVVYAGVCVDSICRVYVVEPLDVIVPNVITPNGDGKNDSLIFKNLEFFPNSDLKIYDRWGKLVYESPNYINDWQGDKVSDGTYYFVLQIPGIPDPKKGFVEVLSHK